MTKGTADSAPTKWQLAAHTRAKHQILASYLDGWFPVLSSTYGRILFLDGFAGRGVYEDGSPGSPIIALQRLLDHAYFPRLGEREFVFIFVEADDNNVKSLKAELQRFVARREPWPKNVTYHVIHSTFETAASDILGGIKRS